ncbi:hypothetical protein HDK77DRAFT_428445 [Phyllosticta capitalensis]
MTHMRTISGASWRLPIRACLHIFGFTLSSISAIMDDLEDGEACRARYWVAQLAALTPGDLATAARCVLYARVEAWRLEWDGAQRAGVRPRRSKDRGVNMWRPHLAERSCGADEVERAVRMLEDLLRDRGPEYKKRRDEAVWKEAAEAEKELQAILDAGYDEPFADQVRDVLDQAKRWKAQQIEQGNERIVREWERRPLDLRRVEVKSAGSKKAGEEGDMEKMAEEKAPKEVNKEKATEDKTVEDKTTEDKKAVKDKTTDEKPTSTTANEKSAKEPTTKARTADERQEEKKAKERERKKKNKAKKKGLQRLAVAEKEARLALAAAPYDGASRATEVLKNLNTIAPGLVPRILESNEDEFDAATQYVAVATQVMDKVKTMGPTEAATMVQVLKDHGLFSTEEVVAKPGQTVPEFRDAIIATLKERLGAVEEEVVGDRSGKAASANTASTKKDKVDKAAVKGKGVEKQDETPTTEESNIIEGIKRLTKSCFGQRVKSRSLLSTEATPAQDQKEVHSAVEKQKEAVSKSDSHQGTNAAAPASTQSKAHNSDGEEKKPEDSDSDSQVTIDDIMAAAHALGDPSLTETPPTPFSVDTFTSQLLSRQNLTRPSPPLNLGSFCLGPQMSGEARDLLAVPAKMHQHFYCSASPEERFYDAVRKYLDVETLWRVYLKGCERAGEAPLSRPAWAKQTRHDKYFEELFRAQPGATTVAVDWDAVKKCLDEVYDEWQDFLRTELLTTWGELALYGAGRVGMEADDGDGA